MTQTKAQLIDGKSAEIEFSGGSAGAPAISFTGDTNTGIYSPGADQVAISTNGTERLYVGNTGRIAIGNTAPQDQLAITGGGLGFAETGGAARNISWKNQADNIAPVLIRGDAVNGTLAFWTNTFGNSATERLRITSAGLVGVGTSTPGSQLDIVAQDNIRGTGFQPFWTLRDSNDSNKGIRLQTAGGAGLFYTDSVGNGTWVERVRVTAGGNVGIGTTSPGNPLTVANTSGQYDTNVFLIETSHVTSKRCAINFNNAWLLNSDTNGSGVEDLGFYSIANNRSPLRLTHDGSTFITGVSGRSPLVVYTDATEAARIDSSGRLLVGTSTARGDFFNVSSGRAPVFQIEGTSTNAYGMSITGNSNSDNGAEINLAKSRGTNTGSSTIVQNGDTLARISFQGADGLELVPAAYIQADVDGTPGANDMPGRLVFSTTADGASSPTERMRITSNGNIIQNYYVFDPYNAAGFITGAGTYIGGDNAPGIGLAYRGGSNANAGVISFGGLSANGNAKTLAAIIVTQDNTSTNRANGYLRFYTNRDSATDASATPIERVRFTDRILCDVTTITSLTSERRLKQDIDSAPLNPELSWNVARDLPIRSFAYKNNPESTNYGYIVDEVEAVDPSLIFDTGETDDKGPIRSYDNAKLQAMYHLALKQALAKIETLEAKVAALETP